MRCVYAVWWTCDTLKLVCIVFVVGDYLVFAVCWDPEPGDEIQ